MNYYLGLQQQSEHLWKGVPSPGVYVPLRLMARGYNMATVIERVWTPLEHGELVYCSGPSWAGHWATDTRVRFPTPFATLTQQLGQALEVHVRVTGPLDPLLLLLCVDRMTADYAAHELRAVGEPLAQAQPA